MTREQFDAAFLAACEKQDKYRPHDPEWRPLIDFVWDEVKTLADEGKPVLESEWQQAMDLLKQAKRHHYYCEDSWYSCPKAEDGSADDRKPKDVCDCGTDEWNAKIDAFLRKGGVV